MKKTLATVLLLCLLGLSLTAGAQENGVFVSVGVGTQATSKAFRGADVSMQAGYNYKGLDISAQIDYYGNHWGRDAYTGLTYEEQGDNVFIINNMNNKRSKSYTTLRLNLGYDLLRFIRGNWRHHLRPYVGLGYSVMHESSNWDYKSEDFHKLECMEWNDRGFELTLGIAYDFNITRHWAVGAFIEESLLTREQDVMGLRLRYSF